MMRIKVMGGNFAPILTMLDRLAHPNLVPLAIDCQGIMGEDMRAMLLDGVNADGSPTAPVREATVRRGRSGNGPARAPSPGSRTIAGYEVEIQQSTDRILLIGGWRRTPFVHFLATGTRHMAARDMIGITPTGQGRLATATASFARDWVGGRS